MDEPSLLTDPAALRVFLFLLLARCPAQRAEFTMEEAAVYMNGPEDAGVLSYAILEDRIVLALNNTTAVEAAPSLKLN